jgi:glycoside/pentoside/hexuronide:cation symporter, GPH family
MKLYFSYGLGALGISATAMIASSWLLYFYLPPDGVPRLPQTWYGTATLIGYLVGAGITPWVGFWSDNLRTRWGRRRPLMLLAALPMMVCFALMWLPPVQGQSMWNLAYLLPLLILYKVAAGFYQIPYQALLPDLAANEHQRVRLAAWQAGFMLLGAVVGGLAGMLVEAYGYLGMVGLYTLLSLVVFYIPAFTLRETKSVTAPTVAFNFRQALTLVLSNRAFGVFALAWALYLMTTVTVQSLAPYIITEVCALRKADTIYFYIPAIVASLICYPLVTRLSDQLGKWKVYTSSLAASAIVFPGLMLIGQWLPIPMRLQCASWSALQAAAISGVMVLSTAFVAEITDHDAAQTTAPPRAAMYYAVMKVLDQTFSGIASLLVPALLLLGRGQTDPHGPLGVRLAGLAAGMHMIVAVAIMWRYPLRHKPPR